MNLERGTLVIRNKLYGDRSVPAYISDGVAIAKAYDSWGVFHEKSGMEIYRRLSRKTLKEAKEVAKKVWMLDVDWTEEDPRILKHADELRLIADS